MLDNVARNRTRNKPVICQDASSSITFDKFGNMNRRNSVLGQNAYSSVMLNHIDRNRARN